MVTIAEPLRTDHQAVLAGEGILSSDSPGDLKDLGATFTSALEHYLELTCWSRAQKDQFPLAAHGQGELHRKLSMLWERPFTTSSWT